MNDTKVVRSFREIAVTTAFLLSGCVVAPQPASLRTVAAFEVPLPTEAERKEFLDLLRSKSKNAGFHVDADTPDELSLLSKVSPMTLHAAVWRGRDDDENVALAMDMQDHLGRVWIMFSKGTKPAAFERFRNSLMHEVKRRWPQTQSLPIMPTGAIPLSNDLIRTPSGYQVNPAASQKYQL